MDTFCLFNPKKLDLQTLRLSVRPSYRSESDVLCGKTPECGEETNNTGKVVGQLVRTFCSICKAVLVGFKKKNALYSSEGRKYSSLVRSKPSLVAEARACLSKIALLISGFSHW